MGVCREFGPQIDPDCEHPMRAGVASCTCSKCGTHCTGRFPACSQVWQNGGVALDVRTAANGGEPKPDLLDDTLPDLADAPVVPAYVPPRRARGAAWTRRRFPSRLLTVGTLLFLGALLLVAAATSDDGENPDQLSVTDQTQVTTRRPPSRQPLR
jgi:hypothetical protein